MDMFRLAVLSAVGVSNTWLALVVYLRNSKNITNRIFAEAVFVIVCWLTLDFVADQALFAPYALLLRRMTLTSAMLMGALLLYFALNFPQRSRSLSPAWYIYFTVGGALMGVTVLTDTVVARVDITNWGTNAVSGPLLPLFAAWAMSGIACVVFVLADKYRRATGRERAQLKFVLLGIALFALSSVLWGLLLPMATGTYELARLNMLSTLLLTGLTAYAIVKHRLMDIRLVVLRGAAYTALIAASGASFVLLITAMRASLEPSLSVSPNVLFFIAGLIVIFGFQPVRYLLERATDRFFYRRSYDPDLLLTELSTAMAKTIDLEQLARLMTDTLMRKMRLTFAAVVYDDARGHGMVSSRATLATPDIQPLLDTCTDTAILLADDLDVGSPANILLARYEARALVPLAIDDMVIGVLLLGAKQSGEMFTQVDVGFLRILAPEAAIAIKNAELFEERNQRVRELTALNQLAFALGANLELDSVLNTALEQVVAVTKADSGSIMLLDDAGNTLRIAAAQGIPQDVVASTRINVGESIAGWVAKTKEALILVDGTDPRFKSELRRGEIISAITVPLICKDKVIGVLSVNRKKSPEFFTSENLNVVTSFAGQLAVTIENAKLYTHLENTFLGTITALAAAVDAKDPHTYGHSKAVTEHAVAVAVKLGLSDQEVQTVRVAATLHDIGKIGIDGEILHKPTGLSKEERAAINDHPAIGANILGSLDFLEEAVPLILFHHERYGGGGYPSGVSGSTIPIGARIISAADSFNAMVSDRPYRNALPFDAAVQELKDNSGTQFDPEVVEALLAVLADEGHRVQPTLTAAPSRPDAVSISRGTRRRTRLTRRPAAH